MPVGGIKEKILAASRYSQIRYVLVPEANRPNVENDFRESGCVLPNNIEIIYLRNVREALIHVFGHGNQIVNDLDLKMKQKSQGLEYGAPLGI